MLFKLTFKSNSIKNNDECDEFHIRCVTYISGQKRFNSTKLCRRMKFNSRLHAMSSLNRIFIVLSPPPKTLFDNLSTYFNFSSEMIIKLSTRIWITNDNVAINKASIILMFEVLFPGHQEFRIKSINVLYEYNIQNITHW